ncbi:MAG TPA: CDP-alcohol phosphatidyltransferase family protein [Usitatibacter sp.]
MAARAIPLALTLLRAALAPIVVLLAIFLPLPWAFGACLSLAFVSDVFDGAIARRMGVATDGLRRMDSVADSIFYAAAVYAVWRLHPDVLLTHLPSLGLLAALEATRYGIDFVKFRREASYHMWSSKLWGIALFLAFFGVLARDGDAMLVPLAIWIGIAADIEGVAISLVLRNWQADVPTVLHALRIRRTAAR